MKRHFLFAVLGIFFLGSCSKMKEPVFDRIDNVRVGKLGLGSSLMTFDMHYYNPNNSKAKLTEASGEAWVDSNYLGHFFVDSAITIPARSNFRIPVKLNMDMKYLVAYSLSGFPKDDVLISVQGTARVGKNGFYRKIPVHYEGRKNLSTIFK